MCSVDMLEVLVVAVALVGCKTSGDAPAKETGTTATGSAGSAAPPTQPPPAPPPPMPTPVAMTVEELKPTCEKVFTAEVVATTHGADKVETKTPASNDKPLAICQFQKGDEVVGSATVACSPDLDVTAIERERAAMTKAKDIPAGIARGGYRISSAFFLNDDDTPCRINANWVTAPEGAALEDALRALTAAVNPTTLR